MEGDELILMTDEPCSLDETIATRQICAQWRRTNYNPSAGWTRFIKRQAVNDTVWQLIPTIVGLDWGNAPSHSQQVRAEQD